MNGRLFARSRLNYMPNQPWEITSAARRRNIHADKGYLNGSLYARLQDKKLALRTVNNRNFA
jgi:hypothetical protein